MQPKWIVPLAGLALFVGSTPTPASAVPGQPAGSKSYKLTLITGDLVQVTTRPGMPERITFIPTAGSSSDAASITRSGGHTFVTPAAAVKDVASGKLDRTLFDVTTLIAEQRDDAHSKTLPVIIRYAGSRASAVGRAKQAAIPGAAKTRVLTSIGARAASVRKTTTFWESVTPDGRVASTIQRVSLDRRVTASIDQSVAQIGAPAAWQRGLTGKGVKVAVLDTGLDATHPDLADRIVASQNFSESADTVDRVGHGTHVASTVAGTGAASNGKYRGVAPDAELLNGKVLDDDGFGSFAGIIAGMEWAVAQGADVVNLSLGSQEPSDGTDDLSQAVNRLSTDTLFVVAAGNCFFPAPGSISSPAAADQALAVGNMQRDGGLNPGSCRGPRKGDHALKPEISAPGTGIVAARAAEGTIGNPVDEHYTTLSGTSMATPHVAGTAALIAQAHPDWKADKLRARLISTADPQDGSSVTEQGAGRVDADQASTSDVTVDAGELELGVLAWPYPAKDLVTRELTYTNPGDAPITLQLAVSTNPAAAAPTLSASQVVVPAKGEAKVTVTADRAANGPGEVSGRITATALGADPLVTTIGWYAEPEVYSLTINGINRDGSPANAQLLVVGLDGQDTGLGPDGISLIDGKASLRVPPGRYEVSSVFLEFNTTEHGRDKFSVVVGPETNVTKDSAITLDARLGKSVKVAVANRADLTARTAAMNYVRTTAANVWAGGVGVEATGAPRDYYATPTAKVTTGTSEFSSGARLEVPPYSARANGQNVPVLDFYFGPRFTGTKTLEVVDAGSAKPEELTGVRGKLALIRSGVDDWNGVQVKAAQDAGAAAALLYNPDRPGLNGVGAWWATGDVDDVTLPAMRTSRAIAADLLAKGGPVRITGVAATPVLYDLAVPFANQVPANAVVKVHQHQLARIDEVFGSHVAGMETSETRHGTTPGIADFGGWLVPTFATPVPRTSYVLANQVRWSSMLVNGNGSLYGWEANSPSRIPRAGTRQLVRWNTPVANSGLPAGEDGISRVRLEEGGWLAVAISPFGHGPEQYTNPFGNEVAGTITVDRNGEQLASEADTAFLFVQAEEDAADYRIEFDARRENDLWKYSTEVKSTWTFRSFGGADERMPLVLADLDIPQADGLNQVRVGKPTTITLGLRHQEDSGATTGFTNPKLEISYDGQTWTALPLSKVGAGKFTTSVTHPAGQAGKAPSLRLEASDQAGSKLTQQITRAYALR
ncbi:S8 family serine peptidase [Kribbella sp. NBC_01245]|uniref:S8 family peptidase n=1 Tax=Kribbella sp. NBC_01245 TaxID=2903578 RepID=UPI002E28C7B4|nr:S8 family serine peptidase [Kribbella sp. NBC_01245]